MYRILTTALIAGLLMAAGVGPVSADSGYRIVGTVACVGVGGVVSWRVEGPQGGPEVYVHDSYLPALVGQPVPADAREDRPQGPAHAWALLMVEGEPVEVSALAYVPDCLGPGPKPRAYSWKVRRPECARRGFVRVRTVRLGHRPVTDSAGRVAWEPVVKRSRWVKRSPLGCVLRHKRWERNH